MRAMITLGILSLAVAQAANAQNLIKDGGFERPPPPQAGYTVVNVGARIQAWKVTGPSGGNVLLLSSTYTEEGGTLHFSPHSGKQSLDLTGSYNQGAVGIQQAVTTVPGTNYALTFWLGNQYDGAGNYGGPSSATLYLNGKLQGTYTTDGNTPNNVTWQKFNLQFTAMKSKTKIAFVNATPASDYYCGLDDVSLTVSP